MRRNDIASVAFYLSTALSTMACAGSKAVPNKSPDGTWTGDQSSGGKNAKDGSSGTGCDGHDPTPSGSISDYPLAGGATVRGAVVAKPVLCEQESAYIRIERSTGTRRLGIARSSQGGFDEGCMELPADAQDFSQCPLINPAAILRAAFDRLRAQGMMPNGVGVGPCGNLKGSYDDTNMSVGVIDWRNADDAVDMVAGLLEDYNLRGVVGVAVRGVDCMEQKPKGTEPKQPKPKPICQTTTAVEGLAPAETKIPSSEELESNTAWIRFQYVRQTGAKPIRVETVVPNKTEILYDGGKILEPRGWGLWARVDSSEVAHPTSFFIWFNDRDLKLLPLQEGPRSAVIFSVDIPEKEHGASCRADLESGSTESNNYVVNIIDTNGTISSGFWKGNIRFEPRFMAEGASPSGEVFTLEAIVFKDIRTENP